jgi:amidase
MRLTDEEVDQYLDLVDKTLAGLESLAETADIAIGPGRLSSVTRPEPARPPADENQFNAWIAKFHVASDRCGPLSGVEIGLKDNIALAGYELTAGSTVMKGFVPRIDATIVQRLLNAGGAITGKHNMESFAHSGTGDISDFGAVLNPHDTDYLAGGSTSGGAAAVAAEECDVAIGTDQGGSIRTPAAWCGIVGLKPTTGLVPYTGVLPIDLGVDVVGPMARSVRDVARTLEVIGGLDERDGLQLDHRQPPAVAAEPYTDALDTKDDLTIGVLAEGFGWAGGNKAIDRTVQSAIDSLDSAGINTRTVSVPLHEHSPALLDVLAVSGYTQLLQSDWVGTNHNGWYWRDLASVFSRFRRAQAHELPFTVKKSWLTGELLHEEYGVELYAKANNIALAAQHQYDECLAECDVLAMPTTPVKPAKHAPELGRVEKMARVHDSAANTAIFSLTHHPALSVPCGTVDGLPVGMMLVGKHFDETTVLRAGQAVETHCS